MNGCDGNVYAEGTENFITALACTELEGGLSPSQVGLGLPASSSASSSAAGSGYVDPSVVNDALDCLATQQNCGSFPPPVRCGSACPVSVARNVATLRSDFHTSSVK